MRPRRPLWVDRVSGPGSAGRRVLAGTSGAGAGAGWGVVVVLVVECVLGGGDVVVVSGVGDGATAVGRCRGGVVLLGGVVVVVGRCARAVRVVLTSCVGGSVMPMVGSRCGAFVLGLAAVWADARTPSTVSTVMVAAYRLGVRGRLGWSWWCSAWSASV